VQKCYAQVVLIYLSHFIAIRSRNVLYGLKSQKITKRSLSVIEVNTTIKLVTIACYDKQQNRAYLQPFLR